MECVIREHYVTGQLVSEGAIHISQMEGTPIPTTPRSVRYRNRQTNEEYLCLCGGFAWPGSKPGFAVVVGLQELGDSDRPIVKTIEEIEERDIRSLLRKSHGLYQKYGLNCKEIPWMWYGDAENGLNRFIYALNEELRQKGSDSFFLAPPPYFAESNKFEIYCRTIYGLLHAADKGLIIGPCANLRSHLSTLDNETMYRGTVDEYPAISALGYALCALLEYKPWMVNLNMPVTKPSDPWLESDHYDPFDIAVMGRLIYGVE